jgi:hypothetical protein
VADDSYRVLKCWNGWTEVVYQEQSVRRQLYVGGTLSLEMGAKPAAKIAARKPVNRGTPLGPKAHRIREAARLDLHSTLR